MIIMAQKRTHRRFRLPAGVTDFAVRRNTPDNTKARMCCPIAILRVTDSGCPDQRNHKMTEPIKKSAKIMPKALITDLWLGGAGGAGISSNIAVPVYPIVRAIAFLEPKTKKYFEGIVAVIRRFRSDTASPELTNVCRQRKTRTARVRVSGTT
jgi:hypothetical protein